MKDDQNQQVLEALQRGPLTAMGALRELGIMRLSARVFELRQAGHDITSRQVPVSNRHGRTTHVAEYTLTTDQLNLVPRHPGRGRVSERREVRA